MDPFSIDIININNWENMKVMDLVQQGNYLYLALGSFFDLGDQDYGIVIIDIQNPETPMVKDYWKKGVPNKGSASIHHLEKSHFFFGERINSSVNLSIFNPMEVTF